MKEITVRYRTTVRYGSFPPSPLPPWVDGCGSRRGGPEGRREGKGKRHGGLRHQDLAMDERRPPPFFSCLRLRYGTVPYPERSRAMPPPKTPTQTGKESRAKCSVFPSKVWVARLRGERGCRSARGGGKSPPLRHRARGPCVTVRYGTVRYRSAERPGSCGDSPGGPARAGKPRKITHLALHIWLCTTVR